MRGILEFELPEDQENFQLAQDAWKYKSVLYELDERTLRAVTKYGVGTDLIQDLREDLREEFPHLPDMSDEQISALTGIVYSLIRDNLYELLNQEGVSVI